MAIALSLGSVAEAHARGEFPERDLEMPGASGSSKKGSQKGDST